MIRSWTPKQRLQRLRDLFGPAEALATFVGDAAGPGGLPSWLATDPTNAAAVVEHFLNAEKLHFDWRFAPFWQDEQHDENWPFVGGRVATSLPKRSLPKSAPFGGFGGFDEFEGLPEVAPTPQPASSLPAGAVEPDAVSVTSLLWTELARRGKGTAWLWAYRPYFFAEVGKPALLEGVIKPDELEHAGEMTLLAEGGRKANAFAATLAIAIQHLESTPMEVHTAPPVGYPSQWIDPLPSTANWISPLHGDQRFWDEFDAPPVDQRGQPDWAGSKRFVLYGLSSVEASRVWARRVAISLWVDRQQMWPTRLAMLSVAQRRRLLGWDPLDPRAADPNRCWATTAAAGPGYGCVRPGDALTADVFGFDFRALYWTDGSGAPVQHRPHPDGGPCVLPYSVWATNAYLAWRVAWHEIRPWQAAASSPGTWVSAWLHRRGFSHRFGLLARPMAAEFGPSAEGPHAVPSPRDARSWCVAMNNSFGAKIVDPGLPNSEWWNANAAFTGSLPEVLDANFGGCHMSAVVCKEILAAMNAPAVLSDAGYASRLGAAGEAPGVNLPAKGWPRAAAFGPNACRWADTNRFAHASLVVDGSTGRYVTFHNDRLVGWSGWRFCNAALPWTPMPEWMLLSACRAIFPGQPLPDNVTTWTQLLWSKYEAETSRSAILAMAAEISTVVAADAAYDAAMEATKLPVPPFATRRGAYVASLVRSVNAKRGEGAQDALHVVAPQSYAQQMTNRLLGRESKISHASATHHSQLPLPALVKWYTGGPKGVLPTIEANSGEAMLALRRACACCLGADSGSAQLIAEKLLVNYESPPPNWNNHAIIPWQLETAGHHQTGDPLIENRADVTANWGDLPLNWIEPSPDASAAPLSDDAEIVAAVSWLLLALDNS
ncbi:MAG: hypothetical protein H6747_11085 [Deltaproteobacteria bacterium]|nr:hypothetical protein [Deltaproteobacteria bacterium]